VAQLYPWALSSLYVASYDSQGYGGGILTFPQPGGPGSRIYILQEQGGPVIATCTGFPLRRLLRLAGLRWRYCNPPPTWRERSLYTSIYPSGIGWSSPKSSQCQSQKSKSHYHRHPVNQYVLVSYIYCLLDLQSTTVTLVSCILLRV
jgi:hypothetical protein